MLTAYVSITKLQQVSVYDQSYFSIAPPITPTPDYFEANPRHINNIISYVNILKCISKRKGLHY